MLFIKSLNTYKSRCAAYLKQIESPLNTEVVWEIDKSFFLKKKRKERKTFSITLCFTLCHFSLRS